MPGRRGPAYARMQHESMAARVNSNHIFGSLYEVGIRPREGGGEEEEEEE